MKSDRFGVFSVIAAAATIFCGCPADPSAPDGDDDAGRGTSIDGSTDGSRVEDGGRDGGGPEDSGDEAGSDGGIADSDSGGDVSPPDAAAGGDAGLATDGGDDDSGMAGDATTGDTGGNVDAGNPQADSGTDAGHDAGNDGGFDAGQPFDAGVPECAADGDCGANRKCLAGICRDTCMVWCYNKPSGEVCHSGYCVECDDDGDCPGDGFECDPQAFVCRRKPFDVNYLKFGMFYHTWHCPAAKSTPVHDISEVLAGRQSWGGYDAFHYWDRPAAGYYCPSENDALLRQHAEMLRDAGIQFVFLDATNHPHVGSLDCMGMILNPLDRLLAVWSQVAGAPRVVPWVPVIEPDTDPGKNTIDAMLSRIGAYPGMHFQFAGKPLVLVTENSVFPVNAAKFAELEKTYTVRKMWGVFADPGPEWSFMQRCEESPLDPAPCNQRLTIRNSAIEQITVATAYQADYMSNTTTATPKHQGRTFRKQFETVLNNPMAPIATFTGWNEWIAQRQRCGQHPSCDCAKYPDGCFIDTWDIEFNRDIEPADNEMGDYYYRLLKSCISLFRSGGVCDTAHKTELCCSDYSP